MISNPMKNLTKAVIVALGAFMACQGYTTQATSVTVQELGVSPSQIANINVTGFYSGGAYAGIVKLSVDGVAMDGFCIDPFHFSSSSPLNYNIVPLAEAPKDYKTVQVGGMGAAKAETISKLWAMAYSPTMSATAAAGLQIAIWETIGGANFSVSGNDFGAGALLADVPSYSGAGANLVGLSGPGQDYVVQSVPDGGATAMLLGLGFLGLAAFRKRLS
jgi:hypothetical protein